MVGLAGEIVGPVRPILLLLLGGAVLLLVIATVNVASLVLVRAEGRRLEIAVRAALGASRARLVRQFVAESAALAAVGGGIGLALAVGAMQLLLRLIPANTLAGMPYLQGLGANAHVAAFAGAVSLLAAVSFALPRPCMRGESPPPAWRRAAGGRWAAGGASPRDWWWWSWPSPWCSWWARACWARASTACSRSSWPSTPPAWPPCRWWRRRRSIAARPARGAGGGCSSRACGALPGVESVAVTSLLPVTYNGNTDWIRFVGRPYNGEHNEVNQRDVSAGYFTTLKHGW